jgi:hypothetical protein
LLLPIINPLSPNPSAIAIRYAVTATFPIPAFRSVCDSNLTDQYRIPACRTWFSLAQHSIAPLSLSDEPIELSCIEILSHVDMVLHGPSMLKISTPPGSLKRYAVAALILAPRAVTRCIEMSRTASASDPMARLDMRI